MRWSLGPPRKLGLEIIRAYPSPLGKGGKALALGGRFWGTSEVRGLHKAS